MDIACMPAYNLCMSIVVLDRIHSTFTVFVYANHQKLERSKNTIRVTYNQGKNKVNLYGISQFNLYRSACKCRRSAIAHKRLSNEDDV